MEVQERKTWLSIEERITGERGRQYGKTLEDIRTDHVERYRFAASLLKTNDRILDAACGCGYGSSILTAAGCLVDGIDASPDAISYAEEHWPGPRYRIQKIESGVFPRKWYDTIISFETLEHLKDPLHALQTFKQKTDRLIASVPNEEHYKFDSAKFIFDEYPHFRHYTPFEFECLLNSAGFVVESRHHQKNKMSSVEEGTEGMFMIYICGSGQT